MPLTEAQKAAYYHRCFTAVDGLWFMKTEERHGFDEALTVDEAVWRVLAKIQARWFKDTLNLAGGLVDLERFFPTKLELDEFRFRTERDGTNVVFIIEHCPWHQAMVHSGRGHISERVGGCICPAEYGVWAEEFSTGEERLTFELGQRICQGAKRCVFCFRRT